MSYMSQSQALPQLTFTHQFTLDALFKVDFLGINLDRRGVTSFIYHRQSTAKDLRQKQHTMPDNDFKQSQFD